MTPCAQKIVDKSEGELTEKDANEILSRMQNLAEQRAKKLGGNMEEALKQVAGEMAKKEEMMGAIYERNQLLHIQAQRRIRPFAERFPTLGEGFLAFMEGSSKNIEGARKSVDYQAKAIHGKYFGRLVASLEEKNLLHDFIRGKMAKDIYIEMGELGKEGGRPGLSGNEKARDIAAIVEDTYGEMIARQNRAGAYISKLPGYVIRQTHDQYAIRQLGGLGNNAESKQKSFNAWSAFVLPLLDEEKTFQGANKNFFLKNIHEALYTGTHGDVAGENPMTMAAFYPNMAKKVSESRVLHFKDAESAYKYNQEFGTRDFAEAVMSDLHYRARNIALMENFGPQPHMMFDQILRDLREQARVSDDAGRQTDSLNDWKLQAAFNEITGANEVSQNPTLSRFIGIAKVMAQLSKMGAVLLSSFTDKVFMQSELAHQGISHLNILGKQITGMVGRSPEDLKMLRMMGIAMDGLIGNSAARYSAHSTMSGVAHQAQKRFFDLNLLNWWTDANKASVGELMSAHLGEHSHLKFSELPDELRSVLTQYEITGSRWNALRDTAFDHGDHGGRFMTPDKVRDIPDSVIGKLVEESDRKATPTNIQRERESLETSLRTYLADRTDIAVPTPGAAERRYATFNTKAGTPLGEAVRLVMMFKSFPITIMQKILGREIYGHGAMTAKQWLTSDHKGKFNVAMLIAMSTAAGYLSGIIRDAIKGRTPKQLINEDGNVNWDVVQESAQRGGGLGIMGDYLFSEYDHGYRTMSGAALGPVVGQLDNLAEIASLLKRGDTQHAGPLAGKLALGNTPYINLFYIRPVLDYFIFWNLQEMMTPGHLQKMENSVREKNHQDFFITPSQVVYK